MAKDATILTNSKFLVLHFFHKKLGIAMIWAKGATIWAEDATFLNFGGFTPLQILWRHKGVQRRHFGVITPLLATLLLRQVLRAEWLILLNQNPPFFPPKRVKNRHQFFTKKKLTPLSFLLYFYVVILPIPSQNSKKSSNSNSFPRFFFQMGRNGSKSACPKNFFPPHKSPKPPTTRHY